MSAPFENAIVSAVFGVPVPSGIPFFAHEYGTNKQQNIKNKTDFLIIKFIVVKFYKSLCKGL
jgi:hypothetical protein